MANSESCLIFIVVFPSLMRYWLSLGILWSISNKSFRFAYYLRVVVFIACKILQYDVKTLLKFTAVLLPSIFIPLLQEHWKLCRACVKSIQVKSTHVWLFWLLYHVDWLVKRVTVIPLLLLRRTISTDKKN